MEPKARGLEFEKFLLDLFRTCGLTAEGAFTSTVDQVDGSFDLDQTTYLLEAKWTKDPIGTADLMVFKAKVERRSPHLRGLFISMEGFADRTAVPAMTNGSAPAFMLMDGSHIEAVLAGKFTMSDLLRQMRRRWDERGEPYLRVEEVRKGWLVDVPSGGMFGLWPGM
jgi:hypothetical protein